MTWTLGDLDNRVYKHIDDQNQAQWSLPDEVRPAEAMAFRREWRRILNAYNTYRFAERSLTTDANGQFAFSALDSGTGDTVQKTYKILAITDGQLRQWTQATYTEWPTASRTNVPSSLRREWWLAGSNIQLIPLEVGTSLVVGVNHHPPSILSLTGTASVIDFPEDYELIVAKHAAAILLSGRAGSEDDQAERWFPELVEMRNDLLADISRPGTTQPRFRYSDNSSDWGG